MICLFLMFFFYYGVADIVDRYCWGFIKDLFLLLELAVLSTIADLRFVRGVAGLFVV
jgi:hypothetical protein